MAESVTVEHDGFTVETNTGTAESVLSTLSQTDAPIEPNEQVIEPETSPEAPETPKEKGAKPRENIQARLSELTQDKKREKERADRLEAELATLRTAKPAQTAAPEPAKPSTPAKIEYPAHLVGFDAYVVGNPDASYEDYIDARSDYRREQSTRQPDLSAAVQQEFQRLNVEAAHQSRINAIAATYPDYTESLARTDAAMADAGVEFSPTVIEAIKTSPRGGDVVYWLAKNPDLTIQLARETSDLPISAAPYIRSTLEARLSAGVPPGAVARSPVSQAKAPIKPVGSSPVATPVDESDDEPIEQYIARMNVKDRKAGRL